MAYDKLVDSAQLDADLTSVADAIRAKGGTDAQLAFPAGFVSAVQAIECAGQVVEIVPAQNTTQISIPIEVQGDKLALGISSNVSGAGDVERVVSLAYCNFCAVDVKRYDVVTAEGTADYWGTPLSVSAQEGTLTIFTGRTSTFFAAGERYTIYIIFGGGQDEIL